MIINIRANNCFVFENEIEMSLDADMRNRKFSTNVYTENNFNILKVAGIFGPNNVGKTCFIKIIRCLRDVILNKTFQIKSNIFSKSKICEFGFTFLEKGNKYSFDIKYDTKNKEFVYEKFSELIKDQYGNEKEIIKLLKDTTKKKFNSEDEKLNDIIPLVAKNNILIYLLNTEDFKTLEEIKNILVSFSKKIDVIDMNNIPIEKTIEILKNKNRIQEKVVNFIKNADLDMDNFEYSETPTVKVKIESDEVGKPEENALELPERLLDQFKLTSVYKGKPVSSILFDSTGTKKIVALASYIIESLEKGRILVVDEIDSSLHFKLTRAIVAMFNNELNFNAQLIFTVHDINLMDCKKLFRKEQIWFVHRDESGVYLYSLAEFTANKDGIRETTDIIEKYKKGILGALPEPELIKSLLEVQHE